MANIPANLSYGTVVGQYILAYADSADVGSEPDIIPAQGKIFFKASPTLIVDALASPNPVTILPAVVETTLDSEGYLCAYDGTRGAILMSTDDTDMNPHDWTWTVTFQLTDPTGTSLVIPSYSFSLPAGTTVDLTVVSPVPDANGTYYLVGPTGPQGIQGEQGPPGSLDNLNVTSPITYNTGTNTVGFAGIALDDVTNVTASSPTTGDLLKWSGTAWINSAAPTYAIDDLTDVAITGTPTTNSTLTYNGTNWVNTDPVVAESPLPAILMMMGA